MKTSSAKNRIVGLTGGIACGKSTVLRMLADLGAQTHSADEDARAVLENAETRRAVFDAFPSIRNELDDTLNRAALAAIIYADDAARKRLGEILHPPIRQRILTVLDAARKPDGSAGVLVYEIPLLFENGLQHLFDVTLAVVASLEVQAERLQAREAAANRAPLTTEAIQARLRAQLPVEEKARRADFIIRSDVSLEETRVQVGQLFRDHLSPHTFAEVRDKN